MTYPEKNTIELVCSKVIPRTIWKRREFHLDEPGLTAFVAKTGKILNLRKDEYQNQPAWGGRSESPFRDHFPFLPSKESNSLLMGPLKDSDGRIVGVLKLENKVGAARLQKFSPFEEALHTTLASHIGTAIERARLFEKLDSRAQEEARAALTNELHELSTFIHSLLILRLEVIRNRLDRDPKYDVRGELESLSRSTKSVHSRLRLVMAGLASEETLMVQGLIPALEDLANLMDIRVEFHEKGTLILPGKVENALYRLAGEALFNSKLHGGESVKAMINFEHDAGRYSLEVRDDGKGFDVDTARTNQSSIGLNSMGYYAHTIGAEYDINSVPGYGTTVKVHGKIQAKGTQA